MCSWLRGTVLTPQDPFALRLQLHGSVPAVRASRCFSRVAKFACPRVLDDQKMSEDNQKLRSGCPPDYQIFWEK